MKRKTIVKRRIFCFLHTHAHARTLLRAFLSARNGPFESRRVSRRQDADVEARLFDKLHGNCIADDADELRALARSISCPASSWSARRSFLRQTRYSA